MNFSMHAYTSGFFVCLFLNDRITSHFGGIIICLTNYLFSQC